MPLPHCHNRRKQNNRARRRSKPETEQQIFRPLQLYFRPAAVRLRRKLTSNISEHAEQKAFKCAQRSIYPARSNYYRRNAHRSKHGRRRCNDVKYGFAKNDYILLQFRRTDDKQAQRHGCGNSDDKLHRKRHSKQWNSRTLRKLSPPCIAMHRRKCRRRRNRQNAFKYAVNSRRDSESIYQVGSQLRKSLHFLSGINRKRIPNALKQIGINGIHVHCMEHRPGTAAQHNCKKTF